MEAPAPLYSSCLIPTAWQWFLLGRSSPHPALSDQKRSSGGGSCCHPLEPPLPYSEHPSSPTCLGPPAQPSGHLLQGRESLSHTDVGLEGWPGWCVHSC